MHNEETFLQEFSSYSEASASELLELQNYYRILELFLQ